MNDPKMDPNTLVPVVPQTKGHMLAKYAATMIAGFGQVILAAQQAVPQFTTLFPKKPWIGPAITATGILWLGVQRAMDQSHVQMTNYSAPTPTSATGGTQQ